jgi:enoyl-CoA hydratase/carnithine racemase
MRAYTRAQESHRSQSENLKEGPRAFVEKRKPNWKGQ